MQENFYSVLKLMSNSAQTVIPHSPVRVRTPALPSSTSALAPWAQAALLPVGPFDPRQRDRASTTISLCRCYRVLQQLLPRPRAPHWLSPAQPNIPFPCQHTTPHGHIDLLLEQLCHTHPLCELGGGTSLVECWKMSLIQKAVRGQTRHKQW